MSRWVLSRSVEWHEKKVINDKKVQMWQEETMAYFKILSWHEADNHYGKTLAEIRIMYILNIRSMQLMPFLLTADLALVQSDLF
jgi:hypothetical protein